MTTAEEMWRVISGWIPKQRWVDLTDIYSAVADHAKLDREDDDPDAPGSTAPKWKRNVRNVLQRQKRLGRVDWQRPARYRFR